MILTKPFHYKGTKNHERTIKKYKMEKKITKYIKKQDYINRTTKRYDPLLKDKHNTVKHLIKFSGEIVHHIFTKIFICKI